MKNSAIGDMQPIALPEPVFDRCGTVFEALKLRKTCRSISDKKISLQILSDILWAAQESTASKDLLEARAGLRDRRVIHRRSVSMLPGRKEHICMNLILTNG